MLKKTRESINEDRTSQSNYQERVGPIKIKWIVWILAVVLAVLLIVFWVKWNSRK